MTRPIRLFTIGFTQKRAQQFFEILNHAQVRRVIDTRLNNVSQLAGFAKRPDLEYFLKTIGGIEYVHLLELAPTPSLLNAYKKQKGAWQVYEQGFLQLMRDRQIEKTLSPDFLHGSCLLCSEATAHHCHRRLVAEYLREHWNGVEIIHL
jgi:uncharacterized protein (DUF488 family)